MLICKDIQDLFFRAVPGKGRGFVLLCVPEAGDVGGQSSIVITITYCGKRQRKNH